MNINFGFSNANNVMNRVQESIIGTISNKQKQIYIIAIAAIALFSLVYLAKRFWSEKKNEPGLSGVNPPLDFSSPAKKKEDKTTPFKPISPSSLDGDDFDNKEKFCVSVKGEILKGKKQENLQPSSLPVTEDQDENHQVFQNLKRDIQALDQVRKDSTLSAPAQKEVIEIYQGLTEMANCMLDMREFKRIELEKIKEEVLEQEAEIKEMENEIAEKEKNYQELERKIEAIKANIQKLSEGVSTSILYHLTFTPDQEIELSDGKVVKAGEYRGCLTHELKTENLKKNSSYHTEGTHYKILEQSKKEGPFGGLYYHYFFETQWNCDGVLPEIKVCRSTLNSTFYETDIVKNKCELAIEESRLSLIAFELRRAMKNLATLKKSFESLKKTR